MNPIRSFAVVVFILFFVVTPIQGQGGTPHPPTHISPGNGSTITNSNSIQLCAAASDDITGQIHFEIFQAPIPDFSTDWQSSSGQNPVCTTINVPNGHYTWHARARNSTGEGGNASDWTFTVQVGSAPPPTRIPGPQQPTAIPEPGPSFSFSFNPSSAQVGQTVTMHVSVNSSNPGATKITPGCGGVDKTETSEVSFDSHWNTSGCGSGNQTVQVCARSVSDQQWLRANCQSQNYNLSGGSSNGVSADLSADNYNLQPGQCTTMHWRTTNATSVNIDGSNKDLNGDEQICPNVTTKYSLRASNGNGNDATRNFTVQVSVGSLPPINSGGNGGGPQVAPPYVPGMTPDQAKQNGGSGGVDLITYCYSKGFTNAGNSNSSANGWYCSGPQTWSVNWGQVCYDVYGSNYTAVNNDNSMSGWRCVQNGQSSGNGSSGQPNTACGQSPTRLHPGDIAVVSDFDPSPLHIYNTPSRSSGEIFTVPIRQPVSIIAGPSCSESSTWVQIGYQGQDGWAVEVGSSGLYNLIPYGMPLPGLNGSNSTSSNPQTGSESSNSAYSIAHGSASPPPSGSYVHIPSRNNDLNLRSQPNTNSTILGKMATNEYFSVVQVGNGWIQIQTSLGIGWVYAQYVEFTEIGSQPAATQPPDLLPWQQINGSLELLQNVTCDQSSNGFTREIADLANPLSINKLNSQGFKLESSACSPQDSGFAVRVLTWGGTSGSAYDETPSQTATSYAELYGDYVPDFDGELGLEVHLQLNGELFETATPFKAVLPADIGDEIKDKARTAFIGLVLDPVIASLLDTLDRMGKVLDSRAYAGSIVYLKVGNETDQEVGGDLFMLIPPSDAWATFLLTSLVPFRRQQFNNQEVVLHTVIPVRSGVPIRIHIGMNVSGIVYGTALMFWSAHSNTTVGQIIFTKIG